MPLAYHSRAVGEVLCITVAHVKCRIIRLLSAVKKSSRDCFSCIGEGKANVAFYLNTLNLQG